MQGKPGNCGSENQFYLHMCTYHTRVCTYICVCVRGAVTRKPHNEVPSAGCPAAMTWCPPACCRVEEGLVFLHAGVGGG